MLSTTIEGKLGQASHFYRSQRSDQEWVKLEMNKGTLYVLAPVLSQESPLHWEFESLFNFSQTLFPPEDSKHGFASHVLFNCFLQVLGDSQFTKFVIIRGSTSPVWQKTALFSQQTATLFFSSFIQVVFMLMYLCKTPHCMQYYDFLWEAVTPS